MKVSGFTFLRNGQKLGYPFVASIRLILPVVDEFVIALVPAWTTRKKCCVKSATPISVSSRRNGTSASGPITASRALSSASKNPLRCSTAPATGRSIWRRTRWCMRKTCRKSERRWKNIWAMNVWRRSRLITCTFTETKTPSPVAGLVSQRGAHCSQHDSRVVERITVFQYRRQPQKIPLSPGRAHGRDDLSLRLGAQRGADGLENVRNPPALG